METNIFNDNKLVGAVLVSVSLGMSEDYCNTSLDELEGLLQTAGGEAIARIIQNRETPDIKTYIGSGKVKELADFVKEHEVELVVFDNELTPSQIKNIEDAADVHVIDRTMLILDIFALHAVTAEGKLQVEIACLKYTAPRLLGKGTQLSRLGGGIGTRGPGESKLESDRRHLKRRIESLTAELAEVEKNRQVKRAARAKSALTSIAIVGYTNSGKSTLLNYLTAAGILAEDKLFATLDPTTRKLTLPSGEEVLLTDTVGFIDRLPTNLIKAFKSTLEELKYADMIIKLTDASERSEERERKNRVTDELIEELGGGGSNVFEVYNKCDVGVDIDYIPKDAICISARTGMNISDLLEAIEKAVAEQKRKFVFFFPHGSESEAAKLTRLSVITDREYTDEGVYITAQCDARAKGTFERFIVNK